MTIFAVINQPSPSSDRLQAAIVSVYPRHNYDLGNGTWLVSDSGTASEISAKLGITPEGENGSAVILEVASYFGRANPAIWTWIKTNWEAVNG